MNNKLLLVTAITLLFRESQMANLHENSAGLVRQVLEEVKPPELSLGIDHERDIINNLKATAVFMCEAPRGTQFEASEILQRVKVDTLQDESLYQAFADTISLELSERALERACANLKRSLKSFFRDKKIEEIVNDASYQIKFKRSAIASMPTLVKEIVTKLEPYQVEAEAKDPAVLDEIDLGNLNAVAQIYEDVKQIDNGEGLILTGWQGVNRMLGGGYRRGECWVRGALQHNYKTGADLSEFMHFALFNKPILIDPTKKPLLLRISCEDDLELNAQFMYKYLYENFTGQAADFQAVTKEEMAAYVNQHMTRNGWHIKIRRIEPSLWTYRDLCNYIVELEAEGYEVVVCKVDYLLKIPTTGCDKGATGDDVRNMYERVRNFMSAKSVLFITPHQLSSEAKMLVREGREEFVKQIIGKGYYDGCKRLDQVVDGELYQHIEIVNGKSYLTIQRGKHRKIKQTPKEHLFCVLAFQEIGDIPWDIDKADSTRKKAGGGPIGTKEETPFWDFT